MAVDPRKLDEGKWKAEPKKAIIADAGMKEGKRLTTEDGREVCGNDEHRLYVQRGKKIMKIRIKEIELGDELVCAPE